MKYWKKLWWGDFAGRKSMYKKNYISRNFSFFKCVPKLLKTSLQKCAKNNQSVSLKSLKIRQIVTYDWESIIGADTDERGVFLNCLFFIICSVVKYIFSVEEYSLACEKVFSSFIEISQKSTSEFIYLRMMRWQFWLNKLTKWSQMLCPGNKHRKNCECCPGHYLIVDHYSSI